MRLKKLEVNSFAGINAASPVIIDFTESKLVVAEGDFGVGKTSLLNALRVACGSLSKDNADFVNNDTGKIDIDFSFVGKDNCNYTVKVTKSTFKLIYDGVAQPEPITKLKELLGVVGTSPMDIKFKPLKEIVKWLSQYSSKNPEETEKQFEKLKEDIKKLREGRADANRSLKAIDEFLNNEPLYLNWTKSEKDYAVKPDIKKISKSLDDAKVKSDNLMTYTNAVNGFEKRRKEIEDEVDKLMKEAADLDKRLVNGKAEIDKIWNANDEYAEIKKEYDNAAKKITNYTNWQNIKAKKKERDDWEDLSIKADSNEKKLLNYIKELQAEILPSIKGVEIITDEENEGLYLDGKNVAQLSETQWIALVIEIWRKFKVKVVVLDNIGVLGSKGIETLNKLAKDGCHILAAEMKRDTKELTINYE